MVDEKNVEKMVFSERLMCPHCKKGIVVKKIKEIITAPVPGEYTEKVIVQKDTQTTLGNQE